MSDPIPFHQLVYGVVGESIGIVGVEGAIVVVAVVVFVVVEMRSSKNRDKRHFLEK